MILTVDLFFYNAFYCDFSQSYGLVHIKLNSGCAKYGLEDTLPGFVRRHVDKRTLNFVCGKCALSDIDTRVVWNLQIITVAAKFSLA